MTISSAAINLSLVSAGSMTFVDMEVFGGPVRVGKLLTVLPDFFLQQFRLVACFFQFLPENNRRGAFGSHHGQFGGRPGEDHVCPQSLLHMRGKNRRRLF